MTDEKTKTEGFTIVDYYKRVQWLIVVLYKLYKKQFRGRVVLIFEEGGHLSKEFEIREKNHASVL